MHYGEIKYFDIANGPGIRVSLFVSGCPHACKGCFNEAAWNPSFGELFTEEIQGLTLLGGEPLVPKNLHALLPLLRKMKERLPEKDLWCFSGYRYEELMQREGKEKEEILELFSQLSVLVDGRFHLEEKDLRLLFRGSRNQRLISIPETLESGKICLYAE